MKENEILKKTLRHYIDLDLYSNSVIADVAEWFDDMEDECDSILLAQDYINTRAGYNVFYQAVKKKVSDFQKKLNSRLEDETDKVGELEIAFLAALYGSQLNTDGISLPKLRFMPIDGRDTVKSFSERTGRNILRSYETAARSGYIFGQSAEEIKSNAKRSLNQARNGMNSGIMTAVPSFAKSTDRIVFLRNDEEVTWVSMLDGNTCLYCLSLNGTRYKSASEAPMTPHNRCRCILQRTKDITDPIPTYQKYIESLSDEEQYHILGKGRYKLWKEEGIILDKFINNGNIVTLEELREELDLD